jgi:hypothetical protein
MEKVGGEKKASSARKGTLQPCSSTPVPRNAYELKLRVESQELRIQRVAMRFRAHLRSPLIWIGARDSHNMRTSFLGALRKSAFEESSDRLPKIVTRQRTRDDQRRGERYRSQNHDDQTPSSWLRTCIDFKNFFVNDHCWVMQNLA